MIISCGMLLTATYVHNSSCLQIAEIEVDHFLFCTLSFENVQQIGWLYAEN